MCAYLFFSIVAWLCCNSFHNFELVWHICVAAVFYWLCFVLVLLVHGLLASLCVICVP